MRDPFTGALVVATGLMVLVGSILLVDYQSVITSPDDYRILGFQPISSRTYFAVRLTNVLIYTAIPTTAFASGDARLRRRQRIQSGTWRRGVRRHLRHRVAPTGPWRCRALCGPVAAISGRPPAARTVIFSGAAGVPDLRRRAAEDVAHRSGVLGQFTVATSPWLLLHPASWFASYLDVAQGRPRPGGDPVRHAAVGDRARRAGPRSVSGRLSMEYSERLGAMLATTAVAGRSKIASAGGHSRGGR